MRHGTSGAPAGFEQPGAGPPGTPAGVAAGSPLQTARPVSAPDLSRQLSTLARPRRARAQLVRLELQAPSPCSFEVLPRRVKRQRLISGAGYARRRGTSLASARVA